jgi:hypothetical protein
MNEMTTPPTSLVPATSAVQRTAPAAHAAAVQDSLKMPVLLFGWATRAAGNGIDTAKLFALGMHVLNWDELVDMNEAIVRRLTLQQQAWLQGWAAWNRERAEIKGANTVTKLVEQEVNLVAQLGQLFIDQATSFLALQENIEVAYAYWLGEKLGPLSCSGVTRHGVLPRADNSRSLDGPD